MRYEFDEKGGCSRIRAAALVGILAMAFNVEAAPPASPAVDAVKAELEALKREVEALRAQVSGQGAQAASKKEVAALQKEVSEVREATLRPPYEWDKSTSFHFGGYAAVGYSSQRTGGRSFDQAVFVPGFHFNYRDIAFAEAKLETAVAPDGETETKVESANLNLFLGDYAVLTAGKFLSPLGQFQQNYHAPWINKMASRPVGFGEEASGAPLASVGAQIRGGFPLGQSLKANYAVFVANAPALRTNGGGDEIELITNEPGTSAPSNKKIWGGRFSIFPLPSLELGLSAAAGKTALEGGGAVGAVRSYRAAGGDFAWQYGKDFDLRGEYLRQRIGDGTEDPGGPFALVSSSGATWTARYIQAAYKIMPKWEGVFRWSRFDAPHGDQWQRQKALGLNYWYASNVVGKITYEFNNGKSGELTDKDRLLLQLTYGF
jgi:hypothetical protein